MTVLFSCRQQLHLCDDAAPFSLIPSHPVLFLSPHVSRFLRHGTLEFFSKEPFLGMASLKSSLVNSRA